MPPTLTKYPRTPHLEGSRPQPGDEDLPLAPLSSLRGGDLVIEEKLDGANAALRFDARGELFLQSRGHFLIGGPRERHFTLFKRWASAQRRALWDALGDRYVMYGEWLYAKHTVFYDALPHYFAEFDVLDTATGEFLDTARRALLLARAPIVSAPVLGRTLASLPNDRATRIGPSGYKSARWREALVEAAARVNVPADRAWRETDPSDEMEGLYVKVERGGRVTARYKWVRASFLTAVTDAGSHWLERPLVANHLRPGVDLFASCP